MTLALMVMAAPAAAQVITGCAKNKGGALRIVADPGECTARETPISWNQSGPEGPPGPEGSQGEEGLVGPEGPPGQSLRVFDALGNEIGLLGHWENTTAEPGAYRVYLEGVDTTILLDVGGTIVIESPESQVFFEDLDCTGQAFVPRRFVGRLTGEGGRLFVGRSVPSIDVVEYQSRLPGACNNDQGSGPLTDAIPADEITLDDLGLSFPLPAPLYVAPAPEP